MSFFLEIESCFDFTSTTSKAIQTITLKVLTFRRTGSSIQARHICCTVVDFNFTITTCEIPNTATSEIVDEICTVAIIQACRIITTLIKVCAAIFT